MIFKLLGYFYEIEVLFKCTYVTLTVEQLLILLNYCVDLMEVYCTYYAIMSYQ